VSLAVTIGIGVLLLGLWVELLRASKVEESARWEWIVLLALSAAALLSRFLWIGQSSLEHLEVTYLFEAVKPGSLLEVITSRQAAEQMHQPLYPLFLRGWADIRLDEVWLRGPSALFAAFCVPLAFALVRRELSPSRALLLAAITAASPLLMWYGRDASPYALLAFVSLAAIVSAKRLLERPVGWWGAIRTSLWLAFAFYTHFLGAWVAVTVGVWFLTVRRGFSRELWRVTGTTALMCLPWLPAMLMKLDTSVKGLAEDKPIMSYSHELTEAVSEALRMLIGGGYPVWCAVLVLIVVGAVALWRRGSDLAWLAVVAALVGILSEAHITWQIQRSKGILYVDIRHYIYLVPLIFVPIAALPKQVLILPVLLAQIWSSVPIVLETLEKPDVRGAVAYIDKYAAQSSDSDRHAVAYLPAPWYEPLLEYYLLGVCDDLGHARRHEGWWNTSTCEFSEGPKPRTIYGFSPTPERVWASRRRLQLNYLWVLDIRDHRFGLPVPPTDPQERYLCWTARDAALIQRRSFGSWVTVSLYDMNALRELKVGPSPPETSLRSKEVRALDAWPPRCEPSISTGAGEQ
jgi:hypothetical protein